MTENAHVPQNDIKLILGHLAEIQSEQSGFRAELSAFIKATDTRFGMLETNVDHINSRINTPTNYLGLAGVLISLTLMFGTVFGFAVQPLFTDTERNRVTLIEMNKELSERSKYLVTAEELEKSEDDQKEWLRRVSDRVTDNEKVVSGLRAEVTALWTQVRTIDAQGPRTGSTRHD